MIQADSVVTGCRQVLTCAGPIPKRGAALRDVGLIENGAIAGRDGRIVFGGERLKGMPSDLFVAPTIVADLPFEHRIWRDELFVPLVAVGPVKSLDEAFERANDTIYGLTAGFFSEDREEITRFE